MGRDIIEIYRKGINGEIKKLRQEINKIDRDRTMSAADKHYMRQIYMLEQNIAKRELIELFKAYGLSP